MQQYDKEMLKILGKRISELRLKKSASLNKFAFKRGLITSATLSRVENGLVNVKFITLLKIAQVLEISLSELFEKLEFKENEGE
jgi:transcriptional regulator with XRE-family HTH domain